MTIIEQEAILQTPATREEAVAEMKKIEAAGRNCWRSEGKITDDSYAGFIRNQMKRGHESPLEFGTVQFKLITSRDVMAEQTRHRVCSFAIESQRYVNADGDGGIKFIKPEFYVDNENDYVSNTWRHAMSTAEGWYKLLTQFGAKNQDARKVLPNSTATTIFMSCNIREMLHILELRTSPAAYPEMRKLAGLMQTELIRVMPEIFAKDET